MKDPKVTTSVSLHVRVSPALAEAVRVYAERVDMKRGEALRSLLRMGLKMYTENKEQITDLVDGLKALDQEEGG